MIDALDLAQQLIRCRSVTPADDGAQGVLAGALEALGFAVHRLESGSAPDGPIHNLFATIGEGAPHFAFAGHTDVVPVGDAAAWSVAPFNATMTDGQLVGRGANDMKSAIAAFVTAAEKHVARGSPGTLSMIITGDEEGPATHGTVDLLTWMAVRGFEPDACLVGEPTSSQLLGDMIKIGRRGSVNAWITVNGAQGHVAYPARADNPITPLIAILGELKARTLDAGTDWFQPSNLEITDFNVGNPATNVIPARAHARVNIRFNDRQLGSELENWIRNTVNRHAPSAEVIVKISGEAFLTPPGSLSDMINFAIQRVTGRIPELSTTGGTSDARFIRSVCPVVEFGLVGSTMHQVDEMVSVADIAALTDIYDLVLQQFFKGGDAV